MSERRTMALRSSTIVENALQADGSRWVRERHVHVDGREMFVEYKTTGGDLQANLSNHAAAVLVAFTDEVVIREKAAAVKKFANSMNEMSDLELTAKGFTQREINLIRNRVI